MEKLKPYVVTKDSTDKTFVVGDIIWQSENGDINCVQGAAWITPCEVGMETLDFENQVTDEWEVLRLGGSEVCIKR